MATTIVSSFETFIPEYGQRLVMDEFYIQIKKKFRKAGREITKIIADDIINKYNVKVETVADIKSGNNITNVIFIRKPKIK